MKLFQNFFLAATLSEAQRAKKRQVLKSKWAPEFGLETYQLSKIAYLILLAGNLIDKFNRQASIFNQS